MFDGGSVSEPGEMKPDWRTGPRNWRWLDIDDAVKAMVEQGCHAAAIARSLKVSPPTVHRRIKDLGLEPVRGTRSMAGSIRPLIMAGKTAEQIAEEVGCHPGSVQHHRKALRDAGAEVPRKNPLAVRRALFEAKWPGRILLPVRHQRMRRLMARSKVLGHTFWECGVMDESMFVGTDKRVEMEHILYRVRSVDDSSDDWRSEAA